MMSLPEQIRKQAEAVQELYRQMSDEPTDAAPDNQEDAAESTEDTGLGADQPDAELRHEPSPEPVAEGKPRKGKESDTLAQKYRTLQGMYNAEVPRLHQQNRELASRVQQLEQLLATLSATAASTPAPQPVAERLVTDKDVEEYGESIDMMRKVSREEYLPLMQKIATLEQAIQQLQGNVVPQVQNLVQRQVATTEQQFWAQLAAAVPNWRTINDDPDFQTWLLQVDPLVGVTRQTILEDAQRNYDAARVANFFHTWASISGQSASGSKQSASRASQLEQQIAPGRGRGGSSATASSGSKQYTPADIRAFFDAVRQGKYKGREQERDRIERDIFAAQREGRIVMNT